SSSPLPLPDALPISPVRPAPAPLVLKLAPAANAAEEESNRASAQQLLDDASRKLSRVSRDSLPASDSTNYDQAQSFVAAARMARSEEHTSELQSREK